MDHPMKSAITVVTLVLLAMTGCHNTGTNSSSEGQSASTDDPNRTDSIAGPNRSSETNEVTRKEDIMPGVSIVEKPGDFTITMPPPLAGQTQPSGPTIEVVVRIAQGDRYFVGERPVSKAEISEQLNEAATMAKDRVAENCKAVLRIVNEGASSYEVVIEVIQLAADAGVKSISFGPKTGD